MKKKKTPFLDFYKKHFNVLPRQGLCACFYKEEEYKILELFEPNNSDRLKYRIMTDHWGLEIEDRYASTDESYIFSPLRQTIVLLCAAINNEL